MNAKRYRLEGVRYSNEEVSLIHRPVLVENINGAQERFISVNSELVIKMALDLDVKADEIRIALDYIKCCFKNSSRVSLDQIERILSAEDYILISRCLNLLIELSVVVSDDEGMHLNFNINFSHIFKDSEYIGSLENEQ